MDDFKTYVVPKTKIELKGKRYHVFLSFRGRDARGSLVYCMFQLLSAAGVHVFVDDKRMHKGERIDTELKRAIKEAVIHIPIFSKHYAESRWCLWEVTEMLKTQGRIIPLFYGVEPADVKYAETRLVYGKAFENYRKNGKEEEAVVNEWVDALSKVAIRSGWTMQAQDGIDFKFIRGVVSDVINTLKITRLGLPRFAVGLKERMDDVIKLLKTHDAQKAQKVITVGIWGAQGTGKSTLARAVFNDIRGYFKVSTFVSDIEAQGNRLHKLQKQLLKDLLTLKSEECEINDEYHGIARLEEHLANIRALVILDNVTNRKQIEMLGVEFLGNGSRVIVTTRDKRILNAGEDDQVYALQELTKEESLQLFSRHAFLKPYPDKKYKILAQRIVDNCGGLPSSLEAVGRFLSGRKDLRCWEEIPGQFQNATLHEIYKPLDDIYQKLNEDEKHIFLDIACLPLGQDKEAAISYWKGVHLNPLTNLDNLGLKSLVKIDNEEGVISMDGHLRAFGRAIVANESRDPSKRSRVWKLEEACQVLERPGFGSISFSGGEKSIAVFKAENQAATKNLQLLWLGDITIQGDLHQLSSNLRWFTWNSCPLSSLPSEWNMEDLVTLDLSSSSNRAPSQIKQIWKEESEHKHHLQNLRVLRLRGCLLLETLPDLSYCTYLSVIDLGDCSGLREIPQSIGLLSQLKRLNLCRCKDLGELPESICKLSSLEKLDMNGCSSIEALPRTFWELTTLMNLDLGGLVQIEELPPFQRGCCLQKLVLSGCPKLRKLPASIGDLKHLSYLEMNDCRTISDLPEEFGNLTGLEKLFLNEVCRLKKLPESFGNLTNLRTFELRNAHCLTELPENFSKLKSLVHFDASSSPVDCLPTRIGDLSSLEFLNLQGTSIELMPDSVSQMTKLNTLILSECNRLTQLPLLPKTLVKLIARDCKEIRTVDQMSGLKNLRVMDLRNCQCLEELPPLSSLELLAKIDIRGCLSIKNFAEMGFGRLKSLQSLYLSRSNTIGLNLRDLMKNLPLFQRSNPQAEENHPLEANCFRDLVSFPMEGNSRCEGVLLFFELEFNSKGINSSRMEIVFMIDEEETINGTVVATEGEEQFILIFRASHPVVMALENAQSLCVQAKGAGIHIRSVEVRVSLENQGGADQNFDEVKRLSSWEVVQSNLNFEHFMS